MSDLLGAAETAASPYLIYAKLAGIAVVALGLVGAGWWLHGAFDGTAVANSKTQTAQCQTAAQTARADVNEKAATGLQDTVNLASQADADTMAKLGALNIQSQHIMENVDAQKNGNSLDSNPSLAAYLDGLRGAASAPAAN